MADLIKVQIRADHDPAGFRDFERAVGQAGARAESFFNQLKRGVGIDLGGQIASSLRQLPALFQGLIRDGIGYNQLIQQSERGIAAILRSFRPDEVQSFDAALKISRQTVLDIEATSQKLASNFTEVLAAYRDNAGNAFAAGINDTAKQVDLIGTLTDAVKLLGLESRQTSQEIRSLLTGDINQDANLAKAFGITSADIRSAKEAGTLYEFLTAKFSEARVAGQLAAKDFDGALSNLNAQLDKAKGKLAEPLFQVITRAAQDLQVALSDPEINRALQGIGSGLADLLQDGVALTKWAIENRAAIVGVLSVTGRLLGLYAAFRLTELVAGLVAKTGAFLRAIPAITGNTAALAANTAAAQANAAAQGAAGGVPRAGVAPLLGNLAAIGSAVLIGQQIGQGINDALRGTDVENALARDIGKFFGRTTATDTEKLVDDINARVGAAFAKATTDDGRRDAFLETAVAIDQVKEALERADEADKNLLQGTLSLLEGRQRRLQELEQNAPERIISESLLEGLQRRTAERGDLDIGFNATIRRTVVLDAEESRRELNALLGESAAGVQRLANDVSQALAQAADPAGIAVALTTLNAKLAETAQLAAGASGAQAAALQLLSQGIQVRIAALQPGAAKEAVEAAKRDLTSELASALQIRGEIVLDTTAARDAFLRLLAEAEDVGQAVEGALQRSQAALGDVTGPATAQEAIRQLGQEVQGLTQLYEGADDRQRALLLAAQQTVQGRLRAVVALETTDLAQGRKQALENVQRDLGDDLTQELFLRAVLRFDSADAQRQVSRALQADPQAGEFIIDLNKRLRESLGDVETPTQQKAAFELLGQAIAETQGRLDGFSQAGQAAARDTLAALQERQALVADLFRETKAPVRSPKTDLENFRKELEKLKADASTFADEVSELLVIKGDIDFEEALGGKLENARQRLRQALESAGKIDAAGLIDTSAFLKAVSAMEITLEKRQLLLPLLRELITLEHDLGDAREDAEEKARDAADKAKEGLEDRLQALRREEETLAERDNRANEGRRALADELGILRARAAGNTSLAEQLTQEKDIRLESLRIQRDLLVGEEEAKRLATEKVRLEAQGRSSRESTLPGGDANAPRPNALALFAQQRNFEFANGLARLAAINQPRLRDFRLPGPDALSGSERPSPATPASPLDPTKTLAPLQENKQATELRQLRASLAGALQSLAENDSANAEVIQDLTHLANQAKDAADRALSQIKNTR